MKEKKITTRLNITFKTSILSGIIILTLLIMSSYISVHLQSNLSGNIIDEFVRTEQKSLANESVVLKKSLISSMKINLEIFSGAVQGLLSSFDQQRLEEILRSYMKLEGIVAISIFDAYDYDEPFLAAWKNPEIILDEEFPDDIALNLDLSLASDVIHQSEKVGMVRIYYTDAMINKIIENKKLNTKKEIVNFRAITRKNISRSISVQAAVAVGIIIILILTIVMSIRFLVTRPIKHTIAMVRDIARGEGDLTRRLNINRNDEIGEFSRWFDLFINNLQDIIREVSVQTTVIDSSSNEFSKISADMTEGVGSLSDRSHMVAEAAEKMSSNLASVASTMEEAAHNVDMVSTAVDEISSVINGIAKNAEKARSITNDAVSQTKHASGQVNELGNAAREIGMVVETITDISEQVKLLALNATIEAARAGEAGKGFAVVANEIKDLARQTADASSAIKERVHGIQSQTNGTVNEISNISSIVTQINEIVSAIAAAIEEQSATAREIAQNVSHTSKGILQVNENVFQGSSAARQVAVEIARITDFTTEIADSSTKVRSNARDLSGLANHLAEIMGKFKV
ncbi:MAG: HAMP domain-containing protein [Deltaproteobacteria bacterium]|nr:HAMP domain-containing protein [Deltaproteobacteria bacterium]